MDNMSGHGKFFDVPLEINRWNWGAFLGTWIWGYFNNTFISFLWLIPFVYIPLSIYLGIKGNILAWRNKRWKSEEAFIKAQKRWTWIGIIIAVIHVLLLSLYIYNFMAVKAQSTYIQDEAYKMIIESKEAIGFIGEEVEVIKYIRGSAFMFWDTTHSMVLRTERGRYWAAIRLDEAGEVKEILVSHYFVIDGFHEVIVCR